MKKARYSPPEICLCSVVNMGEIGEFTSECLQSAREYLETKKYEQSGIITGVLIGRGMENSNYIRRMEIQIPIKVKQ